MLLNEIKTILVIFLVSAKFFDAGAQPMARKASGTKYIKPQTLRINGIFGANVPHADTIDLILWNDVFSLEKRYYTPHRNFHCPVINGKFHFTIDSVPDISYLSLASSIDRYGNPIELMNLYLAEPGDEITIALGWQNKPNGVYGRNALGDNQCFSCHILAFSGKGSAKFNVRYQMDTMLNNARSTYMAESLKNQTAAIHNNTENGFKPKKLSLFEKSSEMMKEINYEMDAELSVLRKFQHRINPACYQIIKANVIGEHMAGYAGSMTLLASLRDAFVGFDSYKRWYYGKFANLYHPPLAVALKSPYYSAYLIKRTELELMLHPELLRANGGKHPRRNEVIEQSYSQLKKKFNTELKEKLMVTYLLDNNSFLSDSSTVMEDALKTVKKESYWSMLDESKAEKQIGKDAYNFSLPDSTGKHITLDSFRGKVVFIDFWFKGCTGCLRYYQEVVSKVEGHFKNNDEIVFIAISVDESKKIWLPALYSGLYTSPDIINLYKAGSSPIIKQFAVSSFPHPLLIDKQGKIFSNSSIELRSKGTAGLMNKINEALAK